MKKLTIIFLMVSISVAGLGNETYQKIMGQSIDQLFKASSKADYVEIANRFERIAQTEKAEWLPLYYASFAYAMLSYQEPDNAKKDTFLDHAQRFLDQALAIDPNESELHMLQGFLYPARINIDPMTRGMAYMEKLNASLDKALELNPDNPRVYYLRGTMTFHMPEAYGGGAEKALPYFSTADEKFRIFKPKTELSPNWGKEINELELKSAQEQLKE